MALFQEPQGGLNLPPTEFPAPNVPPANFAAVGKDVAKGVQEAGFFRGLWEGLLDIISDILAIVFAFILKNVTPIAIALAKAWAEAGQSMDPAIRRAAAIAVSDLFGLPFDETRFSAIGPGGGASPTSKSIAEVILNGLGGSFKGGAPGQLVPSSARAEQFLTTTTHLAVEGWLEGWIFEATSLGQMETFGQLKDVLVSGLGLGRISRRVLNPVIQLLVEQPFEWLINQTYRPKLLTSSESVRQYVRGRMPFEQLERELGWQGYSRERIEALINAHSEFLSVSQLEQLVLHGNYTQDQAVQHLMDQGYPKDLANAALTVQQYSRVDALERQFVNVMIDGYVKNTITRERLEQAFTAVALPDSEISYLRMIALSKEETQRSGLSLSQAQDAVKSGIWNLNQFRSRLTQLGYSSEDATTLELLTLGDIKDAADAKAKRDAADKAKKAAAEAKVKADAEKAAAQKLLASTKGITLARFEALVSDGLRTVQEYETYLTLKGFTAENRAALVAQLNQRIADKKAAEDAKAANAGRAAEQHVNLGQLEKAVRLGTIGIDEYSARLRSLGFTDDDAALLTRTLRSDLEEADAKAQARIEAQATAKQKGLNLGQFERAVRLGIRTPDDYSVFLRGNGYDAEEAALLVEAVKVQLDADNLARAERDAAQKALANKGISIAQLERAVRAGVSTVDDYRTALHEQGFAAEAIDTLVSLLQLAIDSDEATFTARGQASALLGVRGVSLSDLERAVKLGLVDMSIYRDALKRSGVDDTDADVLVLILTAQRQAAVKAANASSNVSTKLKATGQTLAGLQGQVLKGALSIPQFVSFLLKAGISQAAIDPLVSLLQEQLANLASIDAKRKEADARASARDLNLSQFERAVKSGVRTLAEYTQFLASLGYDAADIATLAATLDRSLA